MIRLIVRIIFSILSIAIREGWISNLKFFILTWYITVASISIWDVSTSSSCHHWLLMSIMMTLIEHCSIHPTEWLPSSRVRLLLTSLQIAATRLAMHWTLWRIGVVEALVILENLWLVPWLLLLFAELVFLLKVNEGLLLFPWWWKWFLTLLSLIVYYRLMLLVWQLSISHVTTISHRQLLTKYTHLWRIIYTLCSKELLLRRHGWEVCELLLLNLCTKISWSLSIPVLR